MEENTITLNLDELELNLQVLLLELDERDRRLVTGCIANSVAE